jgi:hypothetical protein
MVSLIPIIAAIAGIVIYMDFSKRQRKNESTNATTYQ